jgi:hypothetical protein
VRCTAPFVARGRTPALRKTCVRSGEYAGVSWEGGGAHSRSEKTPEKIQVTQTLTRVGWRFARLENKKVATRMGSRTVLDMRLK